MFNIRDVQIKAEPDGEWVSLGPTVGSFDFTPTSRGPAAPPAFANWGQREAWRRAHQQRRAARTITKKALQRLGRFSVTIYFGDTSRVGRWRKRRRRQR